jgi:endonuclease YncB( thermonuclease family)
LKPGKDPFIVIVLIALALGFYLYTAYSGKKGEDGYFAVSEVIDGDTIIVDDGKSSHVRYIGIDAPEVARQDSPGDPLGDEATEFNRKLVSGKRVRLEFDNERYDVYGRTLAYVYAEGVSVNEELLRNGLALPLFIEPNGKYKSPYYEAAEEAKREKRGIWGSLDHMKPTAGNRAFVIDAETAPRYEGKRMIVRGEITDVRKSEKVLVLSMDGKFDVVIFPDDLGNFAFFGIDPAAYYKGRNIEVTGRIRMYKGTPEIILSHPMLIRRNG